MSKVDICDRLRLAPANLIGTDDEERYWVCHDAAREIERLRLTDAEREAIERLCEAVTEYSDIDRKENGCHADDDMAAVAVARGLMKRMV